MKRELKVYNHRGRASYLYDNFGNQYPVVVQIGRRMIGIGEFPYYIEQKFISQVPVNVNFIADGVKSDATHMTATIGTREFKKTVAVRNIPITK